MSRFASFSAWRARDVLAQAATLADLVGTKRAAASERVLCLVSGGLGDKLMALPALRYLASRSPEPQVTAAFVGASPPRLGHERFHVIQLDPGRPFTWLRLAAEGWDEVFVNTIGVFRVWNEATAVAAGARIRRGPRFPHWPERRSAYNRSYVFGSAHETLVNLRGAGAELVGLGSSVAYPLRRSEAPGGSRTRGVVLGLHVTTSPGGDVKKWDPDHFRALVGLAANAGWRVTVMGTQGERAEMTAVTAGWSHAEVVACGTLEEAASRLESFDAFVGNDSGLVHLAAALDVPVVTVMAATDPAKCAPVSDCGEVVAAPCVQGGCYWKPGACARCIDRISPQEVFRAVERVLSFGSSTAPTALSRAE